VILCELRSARAPKNPLANLHLRSYAEFMVKRARIKKFCDEIAEQFRPRKIILFGSYAYGNPTEDSDVDLLVVMNRTRYRGERMSLRIRHALQRDFPLDLLVRTPADMAKRLRWGDSFIGEIVEKGEVMYEAADS
jgi:predicted nucleotidyltransferase